MPKHLALFCTDNTLNLHERVLQNWSTLGNFIEIVFTLDSNLAQKYRMKNTHQILLFLIENSHRHIRKANSENGFQYSDQSEKSSLNDDFRELNPVYSLPPNLIKIMEERHGEEWELTWTLYAEWMKAPCLRW